MPAVFCSRTLFTHWFIHSCASVCWLANILVASNTQSHALTTVMCFIIKLFWAHVYMHGVFVNLSICHGRIHLAYQTRRHQRRMDSKWPVDIVSKTYLQLHNIPIALYNCMHNFSLHCSGTDVSQLLKQITLSNLSSATVIGADVPLRNCSLTHSL